MSEQSDTPSRFVANTETLEDVLKTQTVGLVHLNEFKKRRVELAEQRDREAAEKLQPLHAPSREGSEAPSANRKDKKRKKAPKGKLSFNSDHEGTDDGNESKSATPTRSTSEEKTTEEEEAKRRKANPKLGLPPPKVLTKSTLLREAQERETLRREFLALQERIRAEEIVIPFVFYDGGLYSQLLRYLLLMMSRH